MRYFNNRLTDPDSLSLTPNPLKMDQKYVDFVKLLQSLWASVYATGTDPVSQWTPLMSSVDTTALQAAQTAYNNKKSASLKKKVDNEIKKVDMAKAQMIAPALTAMWLKWSDVLYQQYPSRAFDHDKQLPTNLKIIEYVGVSFAYDDSKDARFTYNEGGVDYKTAWKPKTAKKKKGGTTAMNFIVHPAMVGARKRTREERPPINEDFYFSMTTDEELAIQMRELDGDINYTPPPDYTIETNSTDNSHVSTLFAASASASANTKFIRISPSDGPTGADILNLDPGSDADYFVAALQDAHLSLASGQNSTDQAWESKLEAEDGLLLWLSSFFVSPATDLDLLVKGGLSAPYIQEVQLHLNLPSQTGSSPIIYSSVASNIQQAFSIGDAYVKDEAQIIHACMTGG